MTLNSKSWPNSVDVDRASVEKQLLGTETVQALRMNGFDKRICGLSANNVEEQFVQAGANAFMYKPFPCEGRALLKELHRILFRSPAREAMLHTGVSLAD